MALLFSDKFTRSGSDMGANWTDQKDGRLVTDGSKVVLSAGGATYTMATADNSGPQVNQYVQCYMLVPDTNQNAGILFRYISANEHYSARIDGTTLKIMLANGGSPAEIATATLTQTGSWVFVAVQMIGDDIWVFTNNDYSTANEGPAIKHTDTTFTGQAGLAGLVTTGNDDVGDNGPQWDTFSVFDGTADTIYVDTANTGQSFGTQADPHGTIGQGLNSAGLVSGGKLKVLTTGDTPITNAATLAYRIGHNGKFTTGTSFPTYSVVDGTVTSEGSPSLIIEGTDDTPRTLLRCNQDRYYFQVQSDATYVVVRGFDWEATNGVGGAYLLRTVSTAAAGASSEHSVAIDKCKIQLSAAGTNDDTGVDIGHSADTVRMRYCYGTVRTGRRGNCWLNLNSTSITDVLVEYNVFDGSAGTMRRGIDHAAGATLAGGATWDVDHNTFIDVEWATDNTSALEISDATDVVGDWVFQNNLVYSSGDSDPMEFGVNVVAGSPGGTITAHHNGYFGVTTQRDTGVTEGAGEVDDVDPDFVDVASALVWIQTAQSPAIELPSNWKPQSAQYLESADDEAEGQTLDIGALQSVMAATAGSARSSLLFRDRDARVSAGIETEIIGFSQGEHVLWNVWDDLAILVGLSRQPQEDNHYLRKRILENYQFKGDSTLQGLTNAINRELGYKVYNVINKEFYLLELAPSIQHPVTVEVDVRAGYSEYDNQVLDAIPQPEGWTVPSGIITFHDYDNAVASGLPDSWILWRDAQGNYTNILQFIDPPPHKAKIRITYSYRAGESIYTRVEEDFDEFTETDQIYQLEGKYTSRKKVNPDPESSVIIHELNDQDFLTSTAHGLLDSDGVATEKLEAIVESVRKASPILWGSLIADRSFWDAGSDDFVSLESLPSYLDARVSGYYRTVDDFYGSGVIKSDYQSGVGYGHDLYVAPHTADMSEDINYVEEILPSGALY